MWPSRVDRTWVYGHRGDRSQSPENTLLAFERALAKGADGIEFDVQVAANGKAVVFHDSTLERMTAGADSRRIAKLSAEEACSIVLDQGSAIPSLLEVLRWAEGNGLFLNVELKCSEDDSLRLLSAVEREIQQCASASLQKRILVSSFCFPAIREAMNRRWPWPLAQLVDKEDFDRGVHAGSPSWGFHPHFSCFEDDGALHTQGHSFVNVWTVNDPVVAHQLAQRGVDGVITDAIAPVRAALRG